jgi:hypothetical protein
MVRVALSLAALSAWSVIARSPFDIPKTEWDTLNSTVSGRLARGVPFSRPCFSNVGANVTGAQSKDECAAIQGIYGSASKYQCFLGSAPL